MQERTTRYPDRSRESVAQRRRDIRDMAERGFTTRQIASTLRVGETTVASIAKAEGIAIHADRVVGKARRHNANRIVEQMAMQAQSLTTDVALIDFGALDKERLPMWIKALKSARESLGGFIGQLMKEQQKHGEAA